MKKKNDFDIYTTVGINITLFRKSMGWSISKLAQKTGLSVSFISNIEKGARKPTLYTIEKIASEMGLGISALFKPKENSGYEPEENKIIYEIIRTISQKNFKDK
ncbi:MAG: helix-turn-helix domain-containing protein, partial [Candidatus Goldiibacteriota bacterium]